jgi:hypothetical protein
MIILADGLQLQKRDPQEVKLPYYRHCCLLLKWPAGFIY